MRFGISTHRTDLDLIYQDGSRVSSLTWLLDLVDNKYQDVI